MRCELLLIALVAPVLLVLSAARAEVSVPAIFSENMVLQRDVPLPVWGWADDGEKVKVVVWDRAKELAKAETVAQNGQWRVTLDPLPAGGRYSLLVEGSNRLLFTNVLVGEVWITCGQSNMIMPLNDTAEPEKAIAEGHKYPRIRHIQIGARDTHEVTEPRAQLGAFWGLPKWEDATYHLDRSSKTDVPGSVAAVSYYFARELYKHLDGNVPVGMVDVGAILPVQTWVAPDAVAADAVLAPLAGKGYPNATSRGYLANIAPLAPFPARGVIYYQGEMNAGNAEIYRHGLRALIQSWRKAWNREDLPFLVVQLPGFIKHEKAEKHALDMDANALAQFHRDSANHGFVGIREAQLQIARSVPHVGLAVTIDLGDPYDIHPARKREVAERLFLQARQVAYGEKGFVPGGPIPVKYERVPNGFAVTFDNVGEGLVARGGKLQGFELCDAEGKCASADARIEGSKVIVTSDKLPAPATVRYAWAGYPQATLYNQEGLPATPFRWPIPE